MTMKIWSTILLALAGSMAMAQFNTRLDADQKAEVARIFREFTGTPKSVALTIGERRGRQVEVSTAKDSLSVDLFAGEVAKWKRVAPATVGEATKEEAISLAKKFLADKKITVEGSESAERVDGGWVIAFPKSINGYESPLRDRVTVKGRDGVDSMDREILLGRPRESIIDLKPAMAVDVARGRFADRYGEVKTARYLKTAYEFAGRSELGDNPDNVMGRRLRLAHIIEVTAPGRTAKIAVDTVDGEIVMDEIVANDTAPLPVAEAAEESKKRDDSKRIMIAIIFAIGCLGGTLYWFGRMRRAQSSPVDDEDL